MAVTIRYGVNSLTLEHLDNHSIGEIRDEVSSILSLPENAQVRVNGMTVGDEATVLAGAAVEFVKVAGEKGLSARS